MNYRHLFHAGNFADVHKHAILMVLLEAYIAKEKPFIYIDTHAGIGLYDLNSETAERNPEYQLGIMKLIGAKSTSPHLKRYLELIKPFWEEKQYPGSPLIAQSLMAPQDELILNEYHPDDAMTLKKFFKQDERVHCHHRDAYEFLPAILPPELKRALILIDPPYEAKTEFDDLFKLIKLSYQRFPQGCYVIWYPIKETQHQPFTRKLLQTFTREKCIINEVILTTDPDAEGLRGSGLAIINPPWGVEAVIRDLGDEVARLLG